MAKNKCLKITENGVDRFLDVEWYAVLKSERTEGEGEGDDLVVIPTKEIRLHSCVYETQIDLNTKKNELKWFCNKLKELKKHVLSIDVSDWEAGLVDDIVYNVLKLKLEENGDFVVAKILN